jgi:hypothetical protein
MIRISSVVFLSFLFIAFVGCDGDDGDATPPGNGGNGGGGGTSTVLASGSETVSGGTPIVLFTVDTPGELEGRITWTAPPTDLDLGLVHEGVIVELVTGDSSLTVTRTVTAADVAGGINWELYGGNSGPDVVVDYEVKFTPE